MNTEERIRAHLEQTTSALPTPDRLDEIMAEGRRRQIRTRIGAVLAAAAFLATVVTVANAVRPDVTTPPVLSQPTETTLASPPTTLTALAPADEVIGAIIAGPDGITIETVGSGEALHLTSDDYYPEIAVAYPDQRGGVIFQHAVTPLPWPQGSLLRLGPGATTPSVVASPPEGGRLVPIGPAEAEGSARFVFLIDTPIGQGIETRITALDLGRGQTTDLGVLGASVDISVGGDVISLIDRETIDCPTHSLLRLDGSEMSSPLSDCLPAAAGVTVAGDGRSLGILDQGVLRIVAITDGSEVARYSVPGAYLVTPAAGGWAVRTPAETRLISAEDETSLGPVEVGWVAPFSRPLELGADATLGSDTGDLPCVPLTTELTSQDLPAAVSETRETIHSAASGCDYAALGALAAANGTVFTYGGGTDPILDWVAEGRLGNEPLALMAQLLSTTPEEDPETGTWAWPAAHVDATNEASWAELEPILGHETIELLRQADGYLGYRLGITADGTWQFAVGGD